MVIGFIQELIRVWPPHWRGWAWGGGGGEGGGGGACLASAAPVIPPYHN